MAVVLQAASLSSFILMAEVFVGVFKVRVDKRLVDVKLVKFIK
jgi:hypothetical protein